MKNNLNSIGIDKKTKDTVVVVAMSGGVDSSTVAGLMKKEGYKVIGITLKLYDDTKQVSQSKQCCAGQDILDAKRVAHKLDIDHKILYYQNKFKEGVIDNFVESYLKGETPIPCVQCNQTVKFKDLFMEAKDLKADALITGHYVRSIFDGEKNEMYCAEDHNRDQSYFLFNTKRDQLNFLRFPLGNLLKDETREIAKKLDLNVADKPDSQDICFVPNGDYSSVIKKFEPKAFVKGNIKNIEGKVIGVHDGIVNFTIGQRRGIKVSDKDPLYVIEIDPKRNEIIVGPKKYLAKRIINLDNLNILCDGSELNEKVYVKIRSTRKLIPSKVEIDPKNNEITVGAKKYLAKRIIYLDNLNILCENNELNEQIYVKIRSTGKLIPSKVELSGSKAKVNLMEDEFGVSPGQACVFYQKNKNGYKVLGGGWIKN